VKTVKFCLAILLLMIVSILLPGCIRSNGQTDAKPLSVPAACVKLWDIDLGVDYNVTGDRYYFARWLGDDITLDISVDRGNLADANWENYDKSIVDGIACYTAKSENCWDGTNESGEWIGGTSYTQMLIYEQNGLVCRLSGEASKPEVSLDIVSLKTAQNLMDPSKSEYQQYRKAYENWTAGFVKGKINASINIIPPPLAQAAYLKWGNDENCQFVKDGDLEYYQLKRDNQADSPNSAAIFFLSDHGLVEIRGGVPYLLRNEVPREALDCINIELVEQVIQLVFAK
jgi:hypothetical protein